MEVRFRDIPADRVKSDLVVIPVLDQQLEDPVIRILDRRLQGGLRGRMSKSNFTGADGNTLLHPTGGMLPAAYLFLIGIGAANTGADIWRKAGAKARKEAAAIGADEFAVLFAPGKNSDSAAAFLPTDRCRDHT